MPSCAHVAICGSRSLPASAFGLVGQVVATLAGSGRSVGVGCSAGADFFAALACCRLGVRASVFAVGGWPGEGFWAGSAPVGLLPAAAGGSVSAVRWWAGGRSSVPLAARLAGRSLALV